MFAVTWSILPPGGFFKVFKDRFWRAKMNVNGSGVARGSAAEAPAWKTWLLFLPCCLVSRAVLFTCALPSPFC